MAKPPVRAEVKDKRMLVVTVTGAKNRGFLRGLADADVTKKKKAEHDAITNNVIESTNVKQEINEEDGDGPNRRGTYSKVYVLQHPEIKWVHRGQGRYLPAPKGRPTNLFRSQSQLTDTGIKNLATPKQLDNIKSRPIRTPIPQRRGSWTVTEHSPKEKVSLRKARLADAQTNADDDLRSTRLARRAKAMSTTDSERRSSRITTQQSYNEDEEDSDMAGDKEPTYDKDFVDAHPGEKFYHTGNGWYKRGERPKGHKHAKRRESEGHAIVRRRDGSFQFDHNSTIHVTQLDNYPGVEFHHCGNGWYKPGPDYTGHRTSRIGGRQSDEESDDEDEEEEAEDGVVSKEYARRHTEVEWVHRGNGRYKRKSTIGTAASASGSYPSLEPEREQTIFSKAYVEAHPDEEFHHRGNARYMRGPPPAHWASARRRRSAPALQATQDDDSVLYSKAHVDAHPEEVFHHRGQGRYARGPRKTGPQEGWGADDSSVEQDDLVTTDYVESHPNETFHHRGQGRWARGMPRLGSSNKVAIRGPGARGKDDDGNLLDEEDETNKPPALTALVLKTEGPDKWPGLAWHYRGGGKWGRITKQEFEEMQRASSSRRALKGKGKMRSVDGPEAQLAREAAAAEAAHRMGDDEGFQVPGEMDINGTPSLERPKIKRRRTGKRSFLQNQEDGLATKHSSNSQSQVPTPKPRMLEPEEDILTEEDLPQLYRDVRGDWSPAADSIEGQAWQVGRDLYRPMNPPEKFVKALTKHDPAVRPIENLKRLAANAQAALDKVQQEFLYLERVAAPHARIPRKPAKGGRIPVDSQIFEDRKEADLYDYAFDPRRLGFQDPQAQKIQRDADGRELRNRRNRSGVQNNGTLPGWNFGEDETLGPRRAVKPVNRFDGIVDPPRKRARNSTTATGRNSKAPSMTPDRAATPLGGPARSGYIAQTSGRLTLTGHVPKRVRELRDNSVSVVGSIGREGSPNGARKGRPPGSKNLHKRKDAGIKKGPRKPKVVDSIETGTGSEVEGEGEGEGEMELDVEGEL